MKTTLRIAVVEDQQLPKELLVSYLKQAAKEFDVSVAITTYQDGLDIIEETELQFWFFGFFS